jgi:hypothetical protein
MSHILLPCQRRGFVGGRAADAESRGRFCEKLEDTPVERLETAALCGRKTISGKVEGVEVEDRLPRPGELFLKPQSETALVRWVRGRRLGPRIAQESGAGRRVIGGAVRGHEGQCLAHPERVKLDCREQRFLIALFEPGEGIGQGGPDAAVRELLL